jgi:hypothetical protein
MDGDAVLMHLHRHRAGHGARSGRFAGLRGGGAGAFAPAPRAFPMGLGFATADIAGRQLIVMPGANPLPAVTIPDPACLATVANFTTG